MTTLSLYGPTTVNTALSSRYGLNHTFVPDGGKSSPLHTVSLVRLVSGPFTHLPSLVLRSFFFNSPFMLISRFSYPVDYYQSTASAPHPAATQTSCRTRHTGGGSCCADPPAGFRSVGRVCRVAHPWHCSIIMSIASRSLGQSP